MIEIPIGTTLAEKIYAQDANAIAVTGKVDGDWTKSISKAGAALGSMSVVITEDAKGLYDLTISASHSDTLGLLKCVFEATGVIQINREYKIVPAIPDVNLAEIGGSSDRLDSFSRGIDTMIVVTVDTGSSTTTVALSASTPTIIDEDQWKDKEIVFPNNTTTTALRGQKATITAVQVSPLVLTVSALTDTPVSGDIGIIL